MKHLPIKITTILCVIGLVTCLWILFNTAYTPIVNGCIPGGGARAVNVCTPSWINKHAPYCLVDPVCVSPFYVASPRIDADPQWQGIATSLVDPSFGGHDGYKSIALVNLVLFIVVVSVVVGVIRHARIRSVWRIKLAVGLLVWCLLEWIRWALAVKNSTYFPDGVQQWLSPMNCAAVAATLIPIILVTWLLWGLVNSNPKTSLKA